MASKYRTVPLFAAIDLGGKELAGRLEQEMPGDRDSGYPASAARKSPHRQSERFPRGCPEESNTERVDAGDRTQHLGTVETAEMNAI